MYNAGGGLPLSSSMMFPYDVPVAQSYPYPVPVAQPYLENIYQPVDVPVSHTIQPMIVPTPYPVSVPQPVAVPVDRPYAVPYPVDRPCAVPVPVGVPVPQPYAVPQPVYIREQVGVPYPVPYAVPVQMPQQEYYSPSSYRQVEHIIDEPIYIKRCRRRRRRYRSCTPTPAPLAPIIIPITIPAPAPPRAPAPLQITEYVQDIYPPAQVFTEQVPVGYVLRSSVIQQPNQPSVSTSHVQQQLPTGQFVHRPLSVGGSAQMLQQSNSNGVMNSLPYSTRFNS